MTPVEPPIVNMSKNKRAKRLVEVVRYREGEGPREVANQLKIFVPVGKDIRIVTAEK